jgi:hypothetical protein
MFSSEFFELLKQILASWQVIAVTVALVLYIYIVNYVSRSYHSPKVKKERVSKPKKAAPAPAVKEGDFDEEESGGSSESSNEELGLEEA